MKGLLTFVLMAGCAAFVGFAIGCSYGWLVGLLSRSREKLEKQRRMDLRLWGVIGPALAVILFFRVVAEGGLWYNALAFALVGWVGAAAVKAGIQWSTDRRLAKNAR